MRQPATSRARRVKTIFALLLALSLMGCSAVKLAYNNLPELGYWWLDGYVDFDSAQTPRVREQLARLLATHRKNELPKLLAWVEKAQQMAPADVTPSQVCAFSEDVRRSLLATALDASGPGAELALSLDASQLAHLEGKYAKINAEYASDWLDRSTDQQHKKRYDAFLDRSEDFYGALDREQRTLLRQMVDRASFDPRRIDAERRQRQQESLALLRSFGRNGTPLADVRAAIDAYAKRIASPPPGAWREQQQAQLQEGCEHVAELHNATHPAQREKAVRRLQGYAQDLRDLIATP